MSSSAAPHHGWARQGSVMAIDNMIEQYQQYYSLYRGGEKVNQISDPGQTEYGPQRKSVIFK